MSRILDVYLGDTCVGQLVQDASGKMSFAYAESWLQTPIPFPLSLSLPLRKESFPESECRGFFAGILAEGDSRTALAKLFHISPRNDFALLDRIGGECAGAVTFLPAGETLPADDEYNYRLLDETALAHDLRLLPRRPLLAGEQGVRLSLAGAQSKMGVLIRGGKMYLPQGGAPSTHILKPALPHYPDSVQNEAFCLRLAAAIGIPANPVMIGTAEGMPYLLIERYDRTYAARRPTQESWSLPEDSARRFFGEYIARLHQEDFCQALGILPENKYQADGGPSLQQCFDLVRRHSHVPAKDLQTLLDAVLFNLLIGNNDAHGKNFSLIYECGQLPQLAIQPFLPIMGLNAGASRETNYQGVMRQLALQGLATRARLAPLYDILSTAFYEDLSSKTAMKFGGKNVFEEIYPRHFDAFAAEVGLNKGAVRKRAIWMSETILLTLELTRLAHQDAVPQSLLELIRCRCEQILKRFETDKRS